MEDETSFDDDECRSIAAIKIQAIARGRQTRSIMSSTDIQTAKSTLAARHEEMSSSLSSFRRKTSGNQIKDSKALQATNSSQFAFYFLALTLGSRMQDSMRSKGKKRRNARACKCKLYTGAQRRILSSSSASPENPSDPDSPQRIPHPQGPAAESRGRRGEDAAAAGTASARRHQAARGQRPHAGATATRPPAARNDQAAAGS